MKHCKQLVKLGVILVLALVGIGVISAAPAAAADQYLYINPKHGPVGTNVHVQGSSFTPSVISSNLSANVTTFARTYFPDKTTLTRTTIIDTWGHYDTYFIVSDTPAGAHWIWAYDESASPPVWVKKLFTVEPRIELSKSLGYVGDNFTVSGTGFAASSIITIYFDSSSVSTATTNQNGTFSNVLVTLPPSKNGSNIVRAMDAGGNQSTSQFSTRPRVTVSPTSGFTGDTVTFIGTGFTADTPVTLTFDGNQMVTYPEPLQASSSGGFSGIFSVPTGITNTYSIEASDGTNQAEATFTVVLGGFIDRAISYIGSNITFSGGGFLPDRIAVIYYDNVLIAEAAINAEGNLSATFKIPISVTGNHTISATDGTNTVTSQFTLVSRHAVTLNRIFGYVGSDVVFSGSGFLPGKIITIRYDDIPLSEATTDAAGSFTASFKVPSSAGGEHTISTTDSINTANATFTMESIAPPAPVPLLPGNDTEVGLEISFIWEGVTDPSGVVYSLQVAPNAGFTSAPVVSANAISANATSANATSDNATSANATPQVVLRWNGLTATEYTLLPRERLQLAGKGIYYWRVRAEDNASNKGDWSKVQQFYIDSIENLSNPEPTLSPLIRYSLMVEGVILFGFLGYWLVRRMNRRKKALVSDGEP